MFTKVRYIVPAYSRSLITLFHTHIKCTSFSLLQFILFSFPFFILSFTVWSRALCNTKVRLMGLWLYETLHILKYSYLICYSLIAQQYSYPLFRCLFSEQNLSATKSSNMWILPSPQFVVLLVSEIVVFSLSLKTLYSSLFSPVTEHAQSIHQHPMSTTACVNLFTNSFAQLGCWAVPSYFSCLLNSWHTVLKDICALPGVLVSPCWHQLTFKGCTINVSSCVLCYLMTQLWHCRLSLSCETAGDLSSTNGLFLPTVNLGFELQLMFMA